MSLKLEDISRINNSILGKGYGVCGFVSALTMLKDIESFDIAKNIDSQDQLDNAILGEIKNFLGSSNIDETCKTGIEALTKKFEGWKNFSLDDTKKALEKYLNKETTDLNNMDENQVEKSFGIAMTPKAMEIFLQSLDPKNTTFTGDKHDDLIIDPPEEAILGLYDDTTTVEDDANLGDALIESGGTKYLLKHWVYMKSINAVFNYGEVKILKEALTYGEKNYKIGYVIPSVSK